MFRAIFSSLPDMSRKYLRPSKMSMHLPHGVRRARKHLNAYISALLASSVKTIFLATARCEEWISENECGMLFTLCLVVKIHQVCFVHLQACWKVNIYKYFSTENTRWTARCKIINDLILFIIFILNVMIVLPAEDKPGLPEIASDDRRMNVSLFCYYHCN